MGGSVGESGSRRFSAAGGAIECIERLNWGLAALAGAGGGGSGDKVKSSSSSMNLSSGADGERGQVLQQHPMGYPEWLEPTFREPNWPSAVMLGF